MFFRQLLHEKTACLSYMVGCSTQGVVTVVDPQIDTAIYRRIAKQNRLKITHVIETHVQADHRSGAVILAKETHTFPQYHAQAPLTFPYTKLQEGDTIKVGNRRMRVIYTPGHTDDSITLFVDNWFLLTGDTLFVGDVGRVDLSLDDKEIGLTAKAKNLYHSLFQKLLKLPDYIEIYPGHYAGSSCGRYMDGKPVSTIGYEKRFNEMLQTKSANQFRRLLLKNTPSPPANYRVIKKQNLKG